MQLTEATEGGKEKEDTHTQANPTQSQEGRSTTNKGDRGEGGGRGGKEKGKLKANPKEATLQPKQRRLRRPRERETHTLGLALGKRKMEGVTKDLTDTAISSPITLEEKTPAPRTDV